MNVDDEVLYNTSREFFLPLQGEEKYRTEGFKEIVLIYGTTEESFRKTAALINRVRHQAKGGTPSRTIRDHAEHEGSKIQAHLEQKTRTILHENGCTEAGESQKVIRGTFCQNVTIEEEERLKDIVRKFDLEDQCKSANEASPEQAPGYHREGRWSVRHHGFSRSSLCKVTSEQAPRNLLIEESCSL